ncbi:hypothetical protein T459_16100 [Capsicum annuum]|uniref:Tetrapyrrole methylase domain-containing protein n=1 Tax=Capsicum annuum TaxID=4072 RepID=A0A2G2Z7R1_CAPAN|nr:hypothetical protein T459_16100 [Capsicum annuum]
MMYHIIGSDIQFSNRAWTSQAHSSSSVFTSDTSSWVSLWSVGTVLREKRGGGGRGDRRGPGKVFLVGTEPGDPELLTVMALRVIQNADHFLYDRLVSNEVLDLVGPHARLLYVGKTAGSLDSFKWTGF